MVMPNFLMIGAPKSGTSSIYNYLQQHPQIYMSPEKEPHFFTLENEKIDFQGPGDEGRFDNAVTQLEDYLKLFDGVSEEIAIGEASTTYLSSVKAPERINHYIPNAKLIAVLRNPIDAAYASFLHLVRDGDEPLIDFALALQAEEQRISQNWEGIWHYTKRGLYSVQLKRYFDVFKPEQIKVYLYEDFKSNPVKILQNIFVFLGVEHTFTPDMSSKYNVSGMPKYPVLNKFMVKPNALKSTINTLLPQEFRGYLAHQLKNWNFNQFQKPQMPVEVREKLSREYREDILQLQDLIQQDLGHWLESTKIGYGV